MSPGKKRKPSLLSRLLSGGKTSASGGSASASRKKGASAAKGRRKSGKAAGKAPAADPTSAASDAAAATPEQEPKRPLSQRERTVAELIQMTKIGRRDPERLASLLTTLLAKEREKQQLDQERFDQQVWDIVKRSEDDDGGDQAQR